MEECDGGNAACSFPRKSSPLRAVIAEIRHNGEKRGGAPATGKATLIGLPLEPELRARVDRWAASQKNADEPKQESAAHMSLLGCLYIPNTVLQEKLR
jgi:hypothetical protein